MAVTWGSGAREEGPAEWPKIILAENFEQLQGRLPAAAILASFPEQGAFAILPL
jgi:hypothetical protein